MQKRQKYLLYTNPNNITNYAYIATGRYAVNDVLKSARAFPGSYKILKSGIGTEEKIQEACMLFSQYRFS